ncbi:unnamed protein product [Calicophoron daubneyi]|uniref:proline--tRNA ligase n=1 Tax=Calicophoron daubneyi TaxID=300641 RepID=A0AAV2TQL7_CALDB
MNLRIFSPFSRCIRHPASVFPTARDPCLSQKLLSYTGMTSPSSKGIFILWPLLNRSLEKLVRIIDQAMIEIGAQKIVLPALGDRTLWDMSGRWDGHSGGHFTLSDRTGKDYCLQPTHEEEITAFVGSLDLSQKNLPLRLYQISTKFRDELHPKHGILRGREFLMKDLYSFDSSLPSAEETYRQVCSTYSALFKKLKLPVLKVRADSGNIGGSMSHEFHIPASIGEDTLMFCPKCRGGFNSELKNPDRKLICTVGECPHSLEETNGIEVAHCFLLGQRYSKCFNSTFSSPTGKRLFEMGCFGIGVTRLLAASVEYLSAAAFPTLPKDQITEVRWPPGLAPFGGAIALQKESAKDALTKQELAFLLDFLSRTPNGTDFTPQSFGDIVVDDRTDLSLGRKVVDLKRLGIPWIVVAKSRKEHELIDVYANRSYRANLDQVRMALQDPTNFNPSTLPKWESGENRQSAESTR